MDLSKFDMDELDEIYGGVEKIKGSGKRKKSKSKKADDLPDGWKKGDSHIGRQKRLRNRNVN